MKHYIYVVKNGQTLNDISLETGIKSDEIIKYHNEHCNENGFIIVNELREVNKEIYFPPTAAMIAESDRKAKGIVDFESAARYRCEQVNVSKVDGNTVHFVRQNFQYLLQQSLTEKIGKVTLEEHLYDFSPPVLNQSFEFISKTEFIKNNVTFSISPGNGRIEKILNKEQINKAWIKFRDEEFDKIGFIQKLRLTNFEAVNELKDLGDKQFSPSYSLAEEEYRRNLFYLICFDKFLVEPVEEMKAEEFPFMSTIVPPIVVPVEFVYTKISEQLDIISISKVGTLKVTPTQIEEIEKKYNDILKPKIKYSFTEYILEFTINVEYNTKQQLVSNASLILTEQIADNIENICEFNLKRLQNFKPKMSSNEK
jgi:hypothetical protein